MKKKILIPVLTLALVFSLFAVAFTQGPGMGKFNRGSGKFCGMLPDLTDAQQKQIEELQVKHQKEMSPKGLQMQKLRIELQELMTVDKPIQPKINAKLEEMSKHRLEMQKKRTSHRLAVRELLTEKQRLIFDKRGFGRYGRKGGRGHGGQRHFGCRGHRGAFPGYGQPWWQDQPGNK